MPLEAFDPTELSPQFLAQVLPRPVEAVDWQRIGTERGFAGTVLRLVLQPADSTPATVVAKIGTPDTSSGTEVTRESVFYRDVSPQVAAPTPRCWYAGSSPRGAPVILLDDLSDALPGDALAGASAGEVALVLQRMTPVWRHGDGPPVGVLPRWGEDASTLRRRQEQYRTQWKALREPLQEKLPHPVWRLGEELCDKLSQSLAHLAQIPLTVVHGDLHLDNVMFARGGAERAPVVIDWAAACRGPIVLDIFPFLAMSMTPHDHERLAASMIKDVGRDLAGEWSSEYRTTAGMRSCVTSPVSSGG